MKILYTFVENKEQEIDEIATSKNEAGETVSVTKKVKKEVSHKFGLKTPTRSLIDDAQLYHGVKFSEGLKAGLMSNALIDKRITADGGVLDQSEKEEYTAKVKEFGEKRAEYEKLSVVEDKEKNADKIKELEGDLMLLRKRINELDVKKVSVYEDTAETYARNKTSTWWFLNLSVKYNGEKIEPFFKGESVNEKLLEWDKIEESDDIFMKKICSKLHLLTSFYHRGIAQTTAEFDALLKLSQDNSG